MVETYLIAGILLLSGAIACIRPQWISTVDAGEIARNPRRKRRVRRIMGIGMPLLAAALIVVARLLQRSGTSREMMIVPNIVLLFIGCIVLTALIEIDPGSGRKRKEP